MFLPMDSSVLLYKLLLWFLTCVWWLVLNYQFQWIVVTDREERERCGQLVAWRLAAHHAHAVHANLWCRGLVVDLLVLHTVASLLSLWLSHGFLEKLLHRSWRRFHVNLLFSIFVKDMYNFYQCLAVNTSITWYFIIREKKNGLY